VTTMAVGTPAYMSPEQILGQPLDHRTDIYSLGVMLFQMVTGRRPFTGEEPGLTGTGTLARLRDAHLHATPPRPSQLNPALPPEVDEVILRALAKRPEARWRDIQTMVQAWEHAISSDAKAGLKTGPAQPTAEAIQPERLPTPTSDQELPESERIDSRRKRGLFVGFAFLFVVAMALTALFFTQAQSNTLRPKDIVSSPSVAKTSSKPSFVSVSQAVATTSPSPTWTPPPTSTPTSTPTPSPSPVSAISTHASSVTPVISDVYVEYIIDASNGMMQPWQTSSEAKFSTLQRVLPVHWNYVAPQAHIGLRTYGHRYQVTDERSCSDIELLLPIGQWNAQQLTEKLFTLRAKGMDALAQSLSEAYGDFQFTSDRRNGMILITEGGDTCGGDPTAVVQTFVEAGIRLPIYVIALEPTMNSSLVSIAEASRGDYYEVHDAQSLYDALAEAIQRISIQTP